MKRLPKYIIGHNSKGRKCPWVVGNGKPFPKGQNHPLWKEKASYTALHEWVRRNKPKPDNCELCGKKTKKLDASNISGKYKRDLNDYRYICRSCHNRTDGRIKNFKKNGT